jgi:putative phage-type endonuclease
MKIVNCEQGTPEWFAARAGRVTASCIDDVLAKGRGSAESLTRLKYRAKLVAETMIGRPIEGGFVSKAMEEGTEREPYARAAYELRHDVLVDRVGFVVHPRIERAGASPDSLVGEDGLTEIKCPLIHTHIRYLTQNRVPPEYENQMMWQLACTGRSWNDFVSYTEELPPPINLFVVRLLPDPARIKVMEDEVEKFLLEVDADVAQLRGMMF